MAAGIGRSRSHRSQGFSIDSMAELSLLRDFHLYTGTPEGDLCFRVSSEKLGTFQE